MYAIKINWDKKDRENKRYGILETFNKSAEYVDESEFSYDTKEKAKTWTTEKEAASHITEHYEEVVEI